jgi:DNA-binding NarL/FixJ family response regulator
LIQRVLVVDDYERWRRHVVDTIQPHPAWQVIGEADDGLEAVQKVRRLRPDLILLDIGLPTLDGIEAARRIIADDPDARILFLSEHRSLDIVGTALATGARGYVVKSDAGRDLLPAMQAAVDGTSFVSAGLNAGALAPARRRVASNSHRHEVGFYANEAALLDAYAQFAGAALEQGRAVIVVASDERHRRIKGRLQARRLDIDAAIRDGRYAPHELSATLAAFMRGEQIDEARWMKLATAWIARAAAVSGGSGRVAACGDGASALWANRMPDAALRLEHLWDELAKRHRVDVFCGYATAALPGGEEGHIAEQLRAAHSGVRPR